MPCLELNKCAKLAQPQPDYTKRLFFNKYRFLISTDFLVP
jgi:hypothetical protein